MSHPEISVVIPAKDASPYLSTMFATLAKQFDEPGRMDVVFVDDGSSDRTQEVLEQQAARFPRFTVLRNERPVGLASARNQGMAAASADVIAFLDGDDWLRPGHLAVVSRAVRDLGVDFVRTDHIQVTGDRRDLTKAPMAVRGRALDPRKGVLPTDQSTMVDYPFAWAGAFHRRLLDDSGLLHFPEGYMTAEDRPWIWNLHLNAESFAVVDAPGICYRRQVAGSLTQILDERQLWFIDAFAEVFRLVHADRDAALFLPKATRNWLAILAHQLERSKQMVPGLRRTLLERARATTAAVPQEILRAQFGLMDLRRQLLLMPALEGLRGAPRYLKEALA